MGLPVSQQRPLPGGPDGGGPCGCWDEGLTELVGLPGGRIIALVTAILATLDNGVRGWLSPPVDETPLVRCDADAGEGDDEANAPLTVTGH